MSNSLPVKIGLALGSGSARGLAHIGIIRALKQYNLEPTVVTGSSIGAFMAAAYAIGCLDEVEEWLRGMNTYEMIKQMDISLLTGSGLANGNNFIDYVSKNFGNPNIEDLPLPYAAVATDMQTGRELWLKDGPVWNAARASMALPGMLTPIQKENHWLLDGGLVNPVPVSVCKALGADIIIAVNLNSNLTSRQSALRQNLNDQSDIPSSSLSDNDNETDEDNFFDKLSSNIKERASPFLEQWFSNEDGSESPSMFQVVSSSINIMQDRITRSRLAGEPADVVLSPRLNHIGLMEFTRAEEIIEEGEQCVHRMGAVIKHRLGLE